MELLEFCLHNTYFSFQNKFYEQVEGAAMGSPISLIVANLYMEYFEGKALKSAANPPWYGIGLWITVYQKPTHTDQYLQWDSHHSLSAKYSVMGTLTHRAKTVCKVQNKVLDNNRGEHDNNQSNTNNNQVQPDNNQGASSTKTSNKNFLGQVVIPYTQGTAEGFKNLCGK